MNCRIVFIVGPTAVGKTELAIELAKELNGEIISADSMQIYQFMPIGSAQPTKEQQAEVMHHMIDFVDPKSDYNVAMYQQDARSCISSVMSRGKLPIVCGGTGLYINSLLYYYSFTPAEYDYDYRKSLEDYAQQQGNDALHQKLATVDRKSADNIHPNNTKRIIRALEVYRMTGKPFSSYQDSTSHYYNGTCIIGLDSDRSDLYAKIEERVDKMIALGLVDEVRNLLEYGCDLSHKSMQGLGYKELIEHIQGNVGFEIAVDHIKANTRRFAKRQLTWFRRIAGIHWLNSGLKGLNDDVFTKTINIIGNYSFH